MKYLKMTILLAFLSLSCSRRVKGDHNNYTENGDIFELKISHPSSTIIYSPIEIRNNISKGDSILHKINNEIIKLDQENKNLYKELEKSKIFGRKKISRKIEAHKIEKKKREKEKREYEKILSEWKGLLEFHSSFIPNSYEPKNPRKLKPRQKLKTSMVMFGIKNVGFEFNQVQRGKSIESPDADDTYFATDLKEGDKIIFKNTKTGERYEYIHEN